METFLEIIKSDNFLLISLIVNFIVVVGFVAILFKLSSLNNKYKKFIKKLGNGNNIEEDLENYMYIVERVEKQNNQIQLRLDNLNDDMKKCVQKVGVVRYNAYKDTGSDLSFAVALLDEFDNGVVFNGIYSREMSNIYAKPVVKGESNYTLSEEEKESIKRAIETTGFQKIKN